MLKDRHSEHKATDKNASRTFKHIWLPCPQATASQPKELKFCHRTTIIIMTK